MKDLCDDGFAKWRGYQNGLWNAGHYSAEFTLNVYTNVTKETRKDAARKMGGFMVEVM